MNKLRTWMEKGYSIHYPPVKRIAVHAGFIIVLLLLALLFQSDLTLAQDQTQVPRLCPYADVYAEYVPLSMEEQIAAIDALVSRVEVPNTTNDTNPNSIVMTFGFSTIAVPRDARNLGEQTYGLQAQTPSTIDFFIYHISGPMPLTLRYLAFLNEQQFDLSPQVAEQYRDLNLPIGTATTFPITLPALSPGIYELLVVGIPIGIEKLPRIEGAGLADIFNVNSAGTRISLIVGDEMNAPFPPRTFTTVPAEPPIAAPSPEETINYELELYRDGQGSSYLTPGSEVNAGDVIDIDLRLGWVDPRPYVPAERRLPSLAEPSAQMPTTNAPAQIALLLIRNYEQYPISAANPVLYLELPPDLVFIDVPVQLTVSNNLSSEDIVVVRINNPGLPRCLLSPHLNISPLSGIMIRRIPLQIGSPN